MAVYYHLLSALCPTCNCRGFTSLRVAGRSVCPRQHHHAPGAMQGFAMALPPLSDGSSSAPLHVRDHHHVCGLPLTVHVHAVHHWLKYCYAEWLRMESPKTRRQRENSLRRWRWRAVKGASASGFLEGRNKQRVEQQLPKTKLKNTLLRGTPLEGPDRKESPWVKDWQRYALVKVFNSRTKQRIT